MTGRNKDGQHRYTKIENEYMFELCFMVPLDFCVDNMMLALLIPIDDVNIFNYAFVQPKLQ